MVTMILKNSGQNTLEIALVIIIGIILLLGAISTWNWFNKSMAERMDAYKATRHIALTGDMGRQVNYTPERLNILGMTTLRGVPGDEIPDLPEDPDLQHCYDEFNQRLNQSQVLLNESAEASAEAADITTQFMAVKSALGSIMVFYFPHHERFDSWLFGGDYNKFYNSNFETIKSQFLASYPGHDFIDSTGFISANTVLNNYIDVGISLEDESVAKAQEAADKREQANTLLSEAGRLLTECLGGTPPPANPCKEQCYDDYGRLADQKANETTIACFGGDIELCNQLGNETAILQQQYNDCLFNCTL